MSGTRNQPFYRENSDSKTVITKNITKSSNGTTTIEQTRITSNFIENKSTYKSGSVSTYTSSTTSSPQKVTLSSPNRNALNRDYYFSDKISTYPELSLPLITPKPIFNSPNLNSSYSTPTSGYRTSLYSGDKISSYPEQNTVKLSRPTPPLTKPKPVFSSAKLNYLNQPPPTSSYSTPYSGYRTSLNPPVISGTSTQPSPKHNEYKSPYSNKSFARSGSLPNEENNFGNKFAYDNKNKIKPFELQSKTEPNSVASSLFARKVEDKNISKLDPKALYHFSPEKQNLPETKPTSKTISKIKPNIFKSFESKAKSMGPGLLYIFNHEEFQHSHKNREGSTHDVELLKNTFAQFHVKTSLHSNCTVAAVKRTVQNIVSKDFSKSSCIVIAILSHGNRRDVISAHDTNYSIDDDILFEILKNKSLAGKPKIFIIQACKGSFDSRYSFTDSAPDGPGTPDEIYKFYSTYEGFVSYRGSSGTVFIQQFCDELSTWGKTKPIKEIMETTIQKVKKTTSNKQIPSMLVNDTFPYVFGNYI